MKRNHESRPDATEHGRGNPPQSGVGLDKVRARLGLVLLAIGTAVAGRALAAPSIARTWDERALAAIRVDTPHPPGQARNLFSFSTCMYDAWSAYDPNGSVGFVYHGKHTAPDVAAARREAISYAVWRMMKERHVYSRTAANTLVGDDALMVSLGYDTNNVSRDLSTPAGVGNSIYDAVSAWFINDGANQAAGVPFPVKDPPVAYPDFPAGQGGYVYINPPLAVTFDGITDGNGKTVVDINRWQRLQIVNSVDQNGFPQGPIQPYLGVQWLGVKPYALARIDPSRPWIDPGPPPLFGGASHDQFVKEVVAVIRASSQLDADDGVTMDISPAAYGNNSLDFQGTFPDVYDGHGYASNPITGQPYAPNVVKRGDYARVLSEFWADGPSSETPPGHWNVVANTVSDSPLLAKKIGGTGPVVDDLEWDVKTYFSVNASLHEAACACWGIKRYYDAWRPFSAVRYLGGLGQSSDPGQASFNSKGLPLVPGLIELVTAQTSATGGRHEGLEPGKIALHCWPGETPQRDAPNGTHWLLSDSWTTYQRTNFVTPAFPGYISGHSTFSRSAAEVLTAITGSKFFPGGEVSFKFAGSTSLKNEKGPSQPVELRYATYYDAADGAGLSRIFGGIHPPVDNLGGRKVGESTGKGAWEAARKYFDGSINNSPNTLAIRKVGEDHELRFDTFRAMYYKLQGTTNLDKPFVDVPGSAIFAVDSSFAITNKMADTNKFYRAVRSLTP